jgi:hypothetical protein
MFIIIIMAISEARTIPVNENKSVKVVDHPFFNMAKGKKESVAQQMAALRRPRFDAV